jgi:hypothetical protein
MAYVDPRIAKRLAHSAPIKKAVRAERDEIAARARANLAAHRDLGNARIETSNGDVDAYVELVDDNNGAAAIEYGHWTVPKPPFAPVWVEGLHILGKALP